MGFIRINNRNNFLLGEVKSYHPESNDYVAYWRRHKRRCIEGFWSIDDPEVSLNLDDIDYDELIEKHDRGWRWMTPNLYFYVNFGTILHNPEDAPKTAPKKRMRPHLRDIEWEFFYNWAEARGFSGFEDDEEYTCNRDVLELKEDPEYRIDKTCFNSKGELKEYVPAREYLRKLHTRPLGNALWQNQAQNLFMLGARGFGKDLIHSTLLHYTDGSKKPIRDVKIGDEIFGADGRPTKVVDRFDYNDQEQFEITFSDGRKVTSGLGHLWGVYERKKSGLKYTVKELREIKENYLIGSRGDSRYFVPQNRPVKYDSKGYLIQPYVMGSLLGNGGMTQGNIVFTTSDKESVNNINSLLTHGYKLHKQKSNKYSYTLRRENYNAKWSNIYKEDLKRMGLWGCNSHTKFIPDEYKLGSVEQRLELLRGLLDTDGYISKQGNIEYCTVSDRLKEDFIELTRSLGIITKELKSSNSHRISLLTSLPVFKLKRKLNRINTTPSKYANTNRQYTAIKDIKSVGVEKSVCIAVDNEDKLFLVDDFSVTHNSFMVGVGIILHEILFDGARYYTQESIDNPSKTELLVGAAISSKSADLMSKVVEALDNLPGDWGDGDMYTPSPFYKEMTGSVRPNNGRNVWQHWYEKKVGGQWIKTGTKSNVKHVTFTVENPEAGAGGRHPIIVVEEVGLVPNILTIHGSNTACLMEGQTKFGSAIYLGTGGNMEKIIESQVMFYDPEGFDFIGFDNEWEQDQRKIGWFVPAIYGLNQFKDENGNTDVEAALNYKYKVREKKMRSKDTSAIDLEMLNYPLVPSEMFLTKAGNIFPIALIKEREAEVDGNEKYQNAEYLGRLISNTDTGKVEWKLDNSVKPIRSFPLKDSDKKLGIEGCVVIYQHPFEDEYGDVMYGRYIAGCDPYDHDQSGTGSLGSTIVYDKLTKQIVAEYTGRPETAAEYYEEVRKLLKYYNAKLLYENERKGIYDYFDKKQCTYMLQEQPEVIKDVLQTSRVQRKYGMHMNAPLKRYGEELIKTWLLEPYDDVRGSERLNLHEIRCLPLLKEMIAYNTEGNFDRVMAFMMVMYFIQETRKIEVSKKKEVDNTYIGNSTFFNKGLKRSRKIL